MASPKKKLKVPAGPPAPQDRDQCATAIADYGRTLRNRDRLMAEMNDKIANITEEYQGQIDQHNESLELRIKAIQVYCEANRDELTGGGKVKFANLITGQVEWRKATDSVSVPRGEGLEPVLALLKEKKLDRFIRIKEEINKEAILLDRKAIVGIPGIRINIGKEAFSVTPFEVETP
jgi:phage host-nuclease inhibitor protein Gam